MEFNEKLQELRKREGMTQEELAGKLYVSRTAISKWESGRGYPNIESLKAIARLFSVTVDELLSSDEILTVAEEEIKQKDQGSRCFVLALLDISAVLLLFLPLFAQRGESGAAPATLLTLNGYLKFIYLALNLAICGFAAFMLTARLISGVHWVSDIIGGILLSTSLVLAYAYAFRLVNSRK